MKKYNQLINITNIIFIVLSVIMVNNASFMIYKSFMYMSSAICMIVIVINIVVTIINFIKKQYFIAILGAIISLTLFFFNLGQVFIIGNFITLIISFINLFLTFRLEENSNSKVPFVIFSILNVIILFVIIIPIIMNSINVKNMKKVISNSKENLDLETYIKEDGSEYIFYDKKGKEINRISKDLYGKIYLSANSAKNRQLLDKYVLMSGVVSLNGSKVVLGITNKNVVINTKGEKLFKLCNIFDDTYDVYIQFLNYLVYKKGYRNERFISY